MSAVTPAISPASALKDRRILIAEDGFALANVMETVLSTLGCQVVGPIARVSEGMQLAHAAGLDGALLDVSLDGEDAYALADTLLGRAVPVILVTGRLPEELPSRFRGLPMMAKPFNMPELIRLCSRTFVPDH
jgi:DNA-binding response OmpR family regulator